LPSSTELLAAVVLTYNEEKNIGACLDSLRECAARVFVVDSGSTDRTVEIARDRGATVVTHPFESHSTQWRWALAELPLREPWVLALDAAQALTAELRADILAKLASWTESGTAVGGYLNRRQIFRGRWIRHGGYYPKYLLKLFRRDRVFIDDGDLVDHHFAVTGPTAILRGDLIEDNRNEADIAVWIEKHNRYAVRQAREEETLRGRYATTPLAAAAGNPDERTRLRKRIWNQLPLYLRPLGYFLYRYVVRLGFLDGKQGFIFHFMQAFWYRLLVDINRDELRRTGQQAATSNPPGALAAVKPDRAIDRD